MRAFFTRIYLSNYTSRCSMFNYHSKLSKGINLLKNWYWKTLSFVFHNIRGGSREKEPRPTTTLDWHILHFKGWSFTCVFLPGNIWFRAAALTGRKFPHPYYYFSCDCLPYNQGNLVWMKERSFGGAVPSHCISLYTISHLILTDFLSASELEVLYTL